MTVISRFDEGLSLVAYYNAAGDSIVTTGGEVDDNTGGLEVISVTCGYDIGPPAVRKSTEPGSEIRINRGSEQINVCDTFFDDGTGGLQGLTAPIAQSGPGTVVILEERIATNNGSYSFWSGSGTDIALGITRNGAEYSIGSSRGGSGSLEPILVNTPTVVILRTDGTPENTEFRTDAVGSIWRPLGRTGTLDPVTDIYFGNSSGQAPMRGKQAIMCVYDEALSDVDVDNVIELMHYWRDNNMAPPADTAPSVDSITPPSLTVTAPEGFSFSGSVSGVPEPTLQWSKDGSGDIVGETGSIYAKATSEAADAGTYRLTASSDGFPDSSLTAELTVTIIELETSTSFGPVTCNDSSAVLTWQRRPIGSTDPDDWEDALVKLSGAALEPGLDDGTTQLNIMSGIVADTGEISCLATTSYAQKRTTVQTLTVVAAE